MSRSPTSRRRHGSTTRETSSPAAERSVRRALPILPIALIAAAAIAATGCGGDDEPERDEPPPERSDGGEGERTAQQGADLPVGDGRGGVRLTEIGNFTAPVYVTQPPGERDRLYVVEQGGTVVRVESDGSTETFLDVSDEITAGGEQGLLSLAFDPDFAESGLFYVDYTDTEGDTRVVEYRSSDGRSVEEGSERELLSIEQPFENHNGGLLKFGPDGMLYIGTGDGGSAGDPERNAQDLDSLLGKILRIDPRPQEGVPYRVPASNPFVGSSDARGEIYSYGLRNPWRFSFDREDGALSIGDVGQSSFEEIDLVDRGVGAGANFGWSAFEAEEPFNSDQQAPEAIPPVLAYATADGNCSVTGGYVVRDERLRSLYGRYLYGDFCLGQLRSFPADPGEAARDDRPLGPSVSNLSSFGEDNRGRIYAVSLEGPVSRLDPSGDG